jgi:hypothetical protein
MVQYDIKWHHLEETPASLERVRRVRGRRGGRRTSRGPRPLGHRDPALGLERGGRANTVIGRVPDEREAVARDPNDVLELAEARGAP